MRDTMDTCAHKAPPAAGMPRVIDIVTYGGPQYDLTLELRGVLCVACGDAAMVEDLWGTDPPVLATGAYTAKGVRPHETVLLRLSLVK